MQQLWKDIANNLQSRWTIKDKNFVLYSWLYNHLQSFWSTLNDKIVLESYSPSNRKEKAIKLLYDMVQVRDILYETWQTEDLITNFNYRNAESWVDTVVYSWKDSYEYWITNLGNLGNSKDVNITIRYLEKMKNSLVDSNNMNMNDFKHNLDLWINKLSLQNDIEKYKYIINRILQLIKEWVIDKENELINVLIKLIESELPKMQKFHDEITNVLVRPSRELYITTIIEEYVENEIWEWSKVNTIKIGGLPIPNYLLDNADKLGIKFYEVWNYATSKLVKSWQEFKHTHWDFLIQKWDIVIELICSVMDWLDDDDYWAWKMNSYRIWWDAILSPAWSWSLWDTYEKIYKVLLWDYYDEYKQSISQDEDKENKKSYQELIGELEWMTTLSQWERVLLMNWCSVFDLDSIIKRYSKIFVSLSNSLPIEDYEAIYEKFHIETLSLNNYVSENLPTSIWTLKDLNTFTIVTSQLHIIPREVSLCKKLSFLKISNSPITRIDSTISQMDSLEYFKLLDCNLKRVSLQQFVWSNLISLKLYNCNLTDIDLVWIPESLRILDISNNPLESIEFPEKKPLLETLILTKCKLTEIPKSIFQLSWIKFLTLNDNDIKWFWDILWPLKNLRRLSMQNNDLMIYSDRFSRFEIDNPMLREVNFKGNPRLKQLPYLNINNLVWALWEKIQRNLQTDSAIPYIESYKIWEVRNRKSNRLFKWENNWKKDILIDLSIQQFFLQIETQY